MYPNKTQVEAVMLVESVNNLIQLCRDSGIPAMDEAIGQLDDQNNSFLWEGGDPEMESSLYDAVIMFISRSIADKEANIQAGIERDRQRKERLKKL
jgi:hypothetical protein